MPKKKLIQNKDGLIISSSLKLRKTLKFYYVEKFFNKFLNRFKFEGIDYQQRAYMMRQFWNNGTVSCYKLPKSESENNLNGVVIFTPYVVGGIYNIYDYPTHIRLVNLRGVKFIPNKLLELDKEAVIGYIQRNRKGIYFSIEPMIDKLIDFEITIRTNLKAQKTPWMFGISPENEFKMKQLWENLDSDDPKLFVSLEDLQNAKALVSGASYVIDKLEMQRQQVENEILTRLGIDNIGVMEKKEHYTVGEVDANQQQITSSSDEFIDCLNEFFEQINLVLGYSITVELNEKKETIMSEEDDEDDTNM